MLTAPQLDNLIEILKNRTFNPVDYDEKVKTKINKLYDLLDKIEPISDDEFKVLYISAEKGSIEDYGDFEELSEFGVYSSYEDFENAFKEEYPNNTYWYKMTTNRYKNYRSISINSNNIIYADMDRPSDCFENYQLQELLDFLILKVEKCIKMLEDDTYTDHISNSLPFNYRFGVIKRQDYWNLYPETKEQLLESISQEEIAFFVQNATEKTSNRIGHMTSRKYFECVRLSYENNNYDLNNMTDKELYLKYADGRDEGLSKLDLDSNEQFDAWYNDKDRFGGHPWEIIRGHSFARVNLCVSHDDDGYYLSLDGSRILRKVEIAKKYIALTKNDIPVQIYAVQTLKDAFNGDDYIGIVPNYITSLECSSYFKTYKPTEFTHMDDKMLEHIKWEPLEKIRLKEVE